MAPVTPLVVEVSSMKELQALQSRFAGLVEAREEARLEVVLAPGAYLGGVTFAPAGPAYLTPSVAVDLVLRGGPGVVLDAPAVLRARHLTLEGVSLQVATSVRWHIEGSLTMRDVRVIDGRGASMDGHGDMLQLLATGPESGPPHPVRAELTRCTFARNFASLGMNLLSFDVLERSRAFWDRVEISDGSFLGNVVGADLALRFVREATLRDLLWFRTRADGVLIRSRSSGAIAVEDTTFIVADRAQVAAHGAESPPVTLGSGTWVLAESQPDLGGPFAYTASASQQRALPVSGPAREVETVTGQWRDPIDPTAVGALHARLRAELQPGSGARP